MENKDNLLTVISTLFKWKKPILYTCLIAGLLSLFSFLLPNYYESHTIFYAASPDLTKPDPIGSFNPERDYYGENEDVDRLLTIAESSELVNYLIDKFDLYTVYDIDTTKVKAPFKVKEAFLKLYKVVRTKYDAIELSMEDKDPQLAADIVNAAREKINAMALQLIKSSQKQQMDTYDRNIKDKKDHLIVLNDSLSSIRKRYGVYNTETQSEILAELLAKAEANNARNKGAGYDREIKLLETKIAKFSTGMGIVDQLDALHEEASEQLGIELERLKQVMAIHGAEVTAVHLIETGSVPVVKSRPRRSIILVASVLIAFLFSVFAVLLLENYKDVNWQEITNGQ